jgi:multimeric flavodoxin WrbA
MLFEEMKCADGIVIVCPFYFYIPSKFQVIMERFACLCCYTQEKPSEEFYPLAGKPCALIAISGASGYNNLRVLNHLERFAPFLHMRPVITNFSPFIGVSAKGGDEKEEILRDQKGMKQARELLELLVQEIKHGE